MEIPESTLKVLINSQREIRADLRSFTKSVEKGFSKFNERLGDVEDWKAGHIGFKRGTESKEAKTISRVTFVTVVVSAVIAVCGFFWAIKPMKKQPITHVMAKSVIEEVVKNKMGLK